MEQWYIDFTSFCDQYKQMRDERDRQREEQIRNYEKHRHLIQIRTLKLEAMIKSVELHPGFKVSLESYFSNIYPGQENIRIHFHINDASTSHLLFLCQFEQYTPAIINAITRINDMIPELNTALAADGKQYYLTGEYHAIPHILANNPDRPFLVVRYSHRKKRIQPCPHLPSNKIARKINAILNELYQTIPLINIDKIYYR